MITIISPKNIYYDLEEILSHPESDLKREKRLKRFKIVSELMMKPVVTNIMDKTNMVQDVYDVGDFKQLCLQKSSRSRSLMFVKLDPTATLQKTIDAKLTEKLHSSIRGCYLRECDIVQRLSVQFKKHLGCAFEKRCIFSLKGSVAARIVLHRYCDTLDLPAEFKQNVNDAFPIHGDNDSILYIPTELQTPKTMKIVNRTVLKLFNKVSREYLNDKSFIEQCDKMGNVFVDGIKLKTKLGKGSEVFCSCISPTRLIIRKRAGQFFKISKNIVEYKDTSFLLYRMMIPFLVQHEDHVVQRYAEFLDLSIPLAFDSNLKHVFDPDSTGGLFEKIDIESIRKYLR